MRSDEYRESGYVIVRGLYSREEIAVVSVEANRVFARKELIDFNNMRCRWLDHDETKECRFDCYDPITDLSEPIDRMARDSRLLDLLSTLYGQEACLFKDKLIYKLPGASGDGLYQDYISWESFPKSFLTVLIPIDPANDGNGATEIFPGTHKNVYLSELDGDYHQLDDSSIRSPLRSSSATAEQWRTAS